MIAAVLHQRVLVTCSHTYTDAVTSAVIMGSKKPSTWSVTLNREGKSQPWGIRLAGGADLNTPLIITKVGRNLRYHEL